MVNLIQVDPGTAAQRASQLLRAEGSQSRDGRDDGRLSPAADATALPCQRCVAGP